MKHLVVLASLVCLSSQTAVAERAPTARPLLSIQMKSEVAAPTKTVALWSTGAYTVTSYDAQGALLTTTRGGISNKQMAEVRLALRVAEWDITYSRIMCFAYSPSYRQYLVRDKLMYTAQTCSGAMVDDTTQKSIATIESILAVQ